MEDIDNPVEFLQKYEYFYPNIGYYTQKFYSIETNEFTDNNDYIGFLSSDPEPLNFMSFQEDNVNEPPHPQTQFSIQFTLSQTHTTYTRKVYTFMTLIGDIGGFNGAIFLLP